MPVYIDASEKEIQRIFSHLTTLSPKIRAAANRAVRKTVTYANREIIRRGAAAAGVQQKALARGIDFPRGKRVYRRDLKAGKQSSQASIYAGYNPVKSHYVGKIRKWKRGQAPMVGKHRFPGAFVATFKSGYQGIFKRDPNRRTRTGKPALVEQTVNLDPVAQIVAQMRPGVGMYLKNLLAKELSMELEKKSRA